ncbi:MAG: PQQ-dependent sugar dehydrogenase [Pirellulales bacterium]
MRFSAVFLAALAAVGWGLFASRPTEAEKPSGVSAFALPNEFTPVDTSRVLGSPDPLPLEKVRVFPKLTFERPVELTHARDGSGRLFVLEQKGVIRVFPNDNGAAEAGVFLDLREIVLSEGNEEGLLGLAFHPKYAENGKFYVYYSTQPRSSVIACYRVSADDPNKADRDSEKRILQIPQPFANHNGGSIQFGPDGYLYVGMGDGGSARRPVRQRAKPGFALGQDSADRRR